MADVSGAAQLVSGAQANSWGAASSGGIPEVAWPVLGAMPNHVYEAWRQIGMFRTVAHNPDKLPQIEAGVILMQGAGALSRVTPQVRTTLLCTGRVFLTARQLMGCLEQQRRTKEAFEGVKRAWTSAAEPREAPDAKAFSISEEGAPRESEWLDRHLSPASAERVRYYLKDPLRRGADVTIALIKLCNEGFELVMMHIHLAKVLRFDDERIQEEAQIFLFYNGEEVLNAAEPLAEEAFEYLQKNLGAYAGALQATSLRKLIATYNKVKANALTQAAAEAA